jgi:hypothetical protein
MNIGINLDQNRKYTAISLFGIAVLVLLLLVSQASAITTNDPLSSLQWNLDRMNV